MLPKSIVEPTRIAAVQTQSVMSQAVTATAVAPSRTSSDLTAAIRRSVGAPTTSPPPVAPSPPRPVAAQPILVSLDGPYPVPLLPVNERTERLQARAAEVSQCMRCDVLCSSRKQTVYGEGNVAARVCFFGEAPGEEEDSTGRPFVGRSGALLTKMIEACTLSRDQVYILNTVKCRPPGNRNPMPDEIANCREYFEEQLQIIQPQYIVCLGLVAVQTLLKTTQSIGKLRSRFHKYHNSKVLATYHPSYLLRYPDVKREAWTDLKMLMADMGIDVAAQTKKT
ncbi:MAG TPA: uracil-DNA glycosylase [Planctomycetaceae bacterium]|nr:uracil-DNA glycosylase [Planctomycetaceae bacterium]